MIAKLTSGKEVRDGAAGYDSKEEDSEDISFDVGECELEAVEERLLFTADPVVCTDVFLQSPYSQLTFFFRQPFCGSRKVWENEVRTDGDNYGNRAFDYDCFVSAN